MSFQADNAWPPRLLTVFDHCRARPTSLEHRYYGAYDKLLNYCFGSGFEFYVAPQNSSSDDSRETIDCDFYFVVFGANDTSLSSLLRSRMTVGFSDLSFVPAQTGKCETTTRQCSMIIGSPVSGVSVFSAPLCVFTLATKKYCG
jgi:hypothetical protein